jgi:hypothetical protein
MKKIASMKDDYLDWARIPNEYSFVAIDERSNGMYPAGVPIAYQREPRFMNGMWVRSWDASIKMLDDIPVEVVSEAIIGPLPKASESLRKRPI